MEIGITRWTRSIVGRFMDKFTYIYDFVIVIGHFQIGVSNCRTRAGELN